MRPRRPLYCVLLTLLWTTAPGQSLRFAWLSDTHVGNATGANDLRASVEDINALDSIDFVILSGDITEVGSNEQLQQAKSILDHLRVPYHIIPGNHDTKWSESGATQFARLWGDDTFVFEAAGFRFIGMHEGPIMRMGDGQFAPEHIRWLDSIAAAMPDERQPIIFVTHYPLDEGITNWFEVLDRLKDRNTQLVLVGHEHRNRVDNYEGVPGVMSRSNLRGRDSVGGYTIAELVGTTVSFVERRPGGTTSPAWHTMSLSPPPVGASSAARRPDFSINARYRHVQRGWVRQTGFTITASPERWKDILIVGNSSGTVFGFDVHNGSTLWEFKTHGPVHSTAAAADGYAVFGSSDGSIYCVDASRGSLRWRHSTGAPVVACPAIQDGIVYCGSSDGAFRALSLDSGKVLWRTDGIDGFVETRPVIVEGTVVFGAWDGHLYGLDAATGRLRWKWQGDRPGVLYSPAACWPVASSRRVFIAAPDRMVTCIDVRTGKHIWRTGKVQARETIGISEDSSLVFVRSMEDSVTAFRTRSERPDIAWIADVGFGYEINSAAIRERSGILFCTTKTGFVLALDSRTGGLLWQHRCSVGLVHTPLPLEAGGVALTTYDGDVLVLRP